MKNGANFPISWESLEETSKILIMEESARMSGLNCEKQLYQRNRKIHLPIYEITEKSHTVKS